MGNKNLIFAFLIGVMIISSCDEDDSTPPNQPEACFEMPEATGKVGNEVAFTNCSKNATAYAWDFGDGNTSTQQEPVHTYASSGSYVVTLLAGSDTNTDGALTEDDEVAKTTETIDIQPAKKSLELTIKDGTSWTQEIPTLAAVEGATADLYISQISFDTGKPDFTATSDENGNIVFNDLADGTYFMVVTKGDLSNILAGFLIDGVFQTQEEIDGAAIHTGNPQPGDFKLVDLNGDAIIANDDKVDYQILTYDGELITEEVVIGK